MQGSKKVVELLNEALRAELTAVNQYLLAGKLAEEWGFPKLAAHAREEAAQEQGHATDLIDRILYLEGQPDMRVPGPVQVGTSVREQFGLDYEMEKAAVARYQRGIALCDKEGDPGTRVLLEGKLRDEEEHVAWLETQFAAIDQLGLERYLLRWV
jgi:bacterioferritin